MYKFRSLALMLFLITGIASANQSNRIDSPDGFYQVSPKGVSRISVEGIKDKDGDYAINAYSVKSTYSEIMLGDHVAKGWWYTKTQQSYTRHYEFVIGDSRCNAWSKKGGWSFKYSPKTIIISGKEVNVFKTTNDYFKKAKPSPYCVNIRYNKRTCERARCNDFSQPESNNYLVKSKKDALNIFNEIKNIK